jgi:hypothetical protein
MTTETALQALDDVHAATALLEMYVKAIPDDRAPDRYVVQAALEKLKSASWRLDN